MMAYEYKTEYYLIPPGHRDAVDWIDDQDEAITVAKSKGDGWKVERVTSYLDDREVIWPSDEDAA